MFITSCGKKEKSKSEVLFRAFQCQIEFLSCVEYFEVPQSPLESSKVFRVFYSLLEQSKVFQNLLASSRITQSFVQSLLELSNIVESSKFVQIFIQSLQKSFRIVQELSRVFYFLLVFWIYLEFSRVVQRCLQTSRVLDFCSKSS